MGTAPTMRQRVRCCVMGWPGPAPAPQWRKHRRLWSASGLPRMSPVGTTRTSQHVRVTSVIEGISDDKYSLRVFLTLTDTVEKVFLSASNYIGIGTPLAPV
jgi:hypothetical protein